MNLSHLHNEYNIKLNFFEGPMDILLHLIKKEKIHIYDIPIALITDQYLEFIRKAATLDFDGVGDFILMAAYLINLKSRSLLHTRSDNNEDEEDPEVLKKRLAQRLIEYQTFKKGADILAQFEEERDKVFVSPGISPTQEETFIEADLFDLLKAYYTLIREDPSPTPKHMVTIDPVLVQEEMARILEIIRVKERFFFRLLLVNNEKKLLVISFLAILELVKSQKIKIYQGQQFGDILIQGCR